MIAQQKRQAGVVVKRGQHFARTGVVLWRERGVEPEVRLCCQDMPVFEQRTTDGAHGFVDAQRHVALHEGKGSLK